MGLAVGVCVGGCSWWSANRESRDESVAVWLADRGAGQVVGLDRDWIHRVAFRVSNPIALAPANDGGVWVVSALRNWRNRRRAESHEWFRLDSNGALIARGEWSGFRSVVSTSSGGCAVLLHQGRAVEFFDGGGDRIGSRCSLGGSTTNGEGFTRLVSRSGEEQLALHRGGELGLLQDGRVIESACFDDRLVSACSSRAGWWLLTERRLIELDVKLEKLRERKAPRKAAQVFSSGSGEGVWALDQAGRTAQEFGARGAGWRRREWRLAGASLGMELEHGALLLITPGALLVFDGHGEPRAGQGGFSHLVDLAIAEFETGA